jgi:hypothetical protein
MYYLPPASWWRFVAWLLLGFAVYLSYGYTRSEIGRNQGRPKSAPIWLKSLALGSFLVAVGLLAMPHDESVGTLLSQFGVSTRTTAALGIIALGLLLALVGLLTGAARKQASPGVR